MSLAASAFSPDDWAMSVRLELIEDLGRVAYYRDEPLRANPYELQIERDAWAIGWKLGKHLDALAGGLL
jgi:hypothetical protein